MNKSKTLINTAVSGLLFLGVSGAMAPAHGAEMERCYGVVKAGKNDCQTANSSCAGTSTKDGQADAWIFVPTGTCEKLVGGSLEGKS